MKLSQRALGSIGSGRAAATLVACTVLPLVVLGRCRCRKVRGPWPRLIASGREPSGSAASVEADCVGVVGQSFRSNVPKQLLVIVASLYSTLGICIRGLYSLPGPPTPAALSLVRQVLTVVVFEVILYAGRKPAKAGASARSGARSFQAGFWFAAAELAFWNGATQGLLNAGIAFTGATRASFFVQLSVAITPLFAFVMGQAVPKAVWLGCALALFGVLLIGADGAAAGTSVAAALFSGFNVGDLMCLGSAVTWSAYVLRLGAISRRGLPPVPLQAAKSLLLCPLYAAWVAVDCLLVRRCALVGLWPSGSSLVAWAILVFSAIGPGAFADIWLQRASEKVSAAATNVILSTEPLFTAAFAMLLLGERLGSVGLLGGSLIFSAAVLAGSSDKGTGEG